MDLTKKIAIGVALALEVSGCSAPAVPRPIARISTPKFVHVDGPQLQVRSVCIGQPTALEGIRERIRPLFEALALPDVPVGDACDWTFRTSEAPRELDAQAASIWTAMADADESYAIVTTATGPHSATTEITARSDAGLINAVQTSLSLAQRTNELVLTYSVSPATTLDAPSFGTRGVVEGFYGTPYTDTERITTLRCMAQLRQNKYVYGPKDDPFVHDRWADPYDEAGRTVIAHAAAVARDSFIDFVWAVAPSALLDSSHPTNSIRFSSDDDFARLTAKIESVRRLGVQHFALFLDDTSESLSWRDDQVAFASVAEAHVSLINRLQSYLVSADPAARLLVVGASYSNQGPDWQSYIRAIGEALRPDVDVMWTGTSTYSRSIAAADLTDVNSLLGRRVVVWDNYPWQVIPPIGRSADLAGAVTGILSNPVLNEFQQHPVEDFWRVLGSIADYEWNANAYDAESSFGYWEEMTAAHGGCAP